MQHGTHARGQASSARPAGGSAGQSLLTIARRGTAAGRVEEGLTHDPDDARLGQGLTLAAACTSSAVSQMPEQNHKCAENLMTPSLVAKQSAPSLAGSKLGFSSCALLQVQPGQGGSCFAQLQHSSKSG